MTFAEVKQAAIIKKEFHRKHLEGQYQFKKQKIRMRSIPTNLSSFYNILRLEISSQKSPQPS